MIIPDINLLDIRHLRAVAAISRTKNLTRAAKNLCVSQPAVSRQLKEAEQILGIALFVRSKKEMSITRAGEEVLQAAQNILYELDDVGMRIARLVHGEAGELKIGMHCVLSYRWIPEILRKMQQAYPKVSLMIGNCHRPKKELLKKTWDIVIAAVPFEHPALEQHRLFSDELVLAAHPKNKVAGKPFVSAEDIHGSRFISLTTQIMDITYNFYIHPGDSQSGIFMTVEQPEAILALVKDDFGVAVLPRWAIQNEILNKTITAVPLNAEGVQADWKAVSLKSTETRPYYDSFVDYCRGIQIS